ELGVAAVGHAGRIRAAVDERDAIREAGGDILILARTDARHDHGLSEAIDRAAHFKELGADILFIEAPQSEAEMRAICADLPGPNLANILEGGATPDLPIEALREIGFSIAAYPLSLMASAMQAMVTTLREMRDNRRPDQMDFVELRERIGFNDYYRLSERYASAFRSLERE
ncbi:MAG: isocitrate lyase/phosphoenolpyruvate mutase family protein, partial [Pseudomonadota bacterium]